MKTSMNTLRRRAWLALSLVVGLLFGHAASAITVTKSPTTCASVAGIGTVAWSNPPRAVSNNNSYATATVDGTTTRYLQCTGYSFAIPTGATINGITVSVERRSNRVTDGGSKDAAMRVVKAGVIGATDRSTATTYTTADVIEAHGGAADLWGTTWTAAEINAANFGAAFAATKANLAGASHTISVDHVQITIDYSFAPGSYSVTASPTNCASIAGIGTVAWSNPTRAYSNNNLYATATVDGTTTRYLRCLGYNFAIPTGASINGVTVNVERKSNRTTNGGSQDAAMRLVKAGVIDLTVNRATTTIYTTADVVEAHGGAADLWGTTWTVAQINAANFGAAFAATKASAAGAPHTISVDHMPITVTFTIPAPLDHIRIEHDGAGLTCAPETVTVKACADATCSSLYSSGSTTVTLSGAGWAANPITFTGSTTASLSITTPSTFTLGTSAVSPTPSGASPQCFVGATANCSLVFADTGFLFSTIPTQTAGVTSGSLTIQAVKKADNSAACTGVFTGNVVVNLASQCINPTTCNGKQVTINATAITNNPAAGVPNYSPVTLNFGASSTATFTLHYPDVGNMSLSARYALGSDFMTGTSNTFVVKPFGFTVTGIQRTSDGFANPGAASAAGTAFIKAGDAFTATVTATAQGGAAAPNYGREISPEGVLLTPNIVLPAAGNNPALSNGTIAGGSFASGVATPTTLAWDEVGIITLTPSVADADYLGAGNATGTTTGNVGRFYPHHFAATATLATRADLACAPASNFTYMGEPVGLALTLTAQSAGNGTTQNYTTAGGFAKLDGATAAKWTSFGSADSIGLGAVNGTSALSARLGISGTPSGSWAAGVGSLSANVLLNRAAGLDGPFNTLKLGIAPQDADNAALLPGALDLDADLNASLERMQVPAAATTIVRYGRTRLNNAHGSELLALPVPLKAQYYNGTGFVTNADDNCTAFTLATDLSLGNYQASLAAGETTPSPASITLSGGASVISFSAPGAGNSGSVDLTLNVPAWLEYNWTGVGGDPISRATFGAYRKSDQFIYQRENY
ncbi:MAG: DUF6701 domain-containing protein [Pseudomonadota bacterium]